MAKPPFPPKAKPGAPKPGVKAFPPKAPGKPPLQQPAAPLALSPAPANAKVPQEIGVIGQRISTGYVWEEFLPQLRGEQGRRIYQEMSNNDATVGAVLNSISLIIRGVEWKGIPADDSVEAEKEAKFAESLMKDMSHSWEDHISEALTMLVYGWSYFEMVLKRRVGPFEKTPEKRSQFDDGRIGIRKMAPRAQDTLSRWEMQDDGGIEGMWQMPITGRVGIVYLPIERCVLYRTTARKNSPEGVSVLRTAYKSWYDLKNIEQYEAIGVERELAGLPVVRIPGELFSSTDPADIAVRNLYEKVARDLKFNEQGGLLIPSDTFEDISGSPSSIPKVQIELLSSAGARTIDTDTIIQRKQRGIARACLADFLMLGEGSGTSRGSYGMSESKMDFFIRACEAVLAQITFPLNSFVLPRIFDMNGIDRKLMPKLEPGRLVRADLQKIGKFLQSMAAAGAPLFPDDELENRLRREADLPEKSPEAIAQQKDQQELDAAMAQHQATGAALNNQGKERAINAPPPGVKKAMEEREPSPFVGRSVNKADWNEGDHPRDKDGKFSDSPGGGGPTDDQRRATWRGLTVRQRLGIRDMSERGPVIPSESDSDQIMALSNIGLASLNEEKGTFSLTDEGRSVLAAADGPIRADGRAIRAGADAKIEVGLSPDDANLQVAIKRSFPGHNLNTADEVAAWRKVFGDVSPADVKKSMLGPLMDDVTKSAVGIDHFSSELNMAFEGEAPGGEHEQWKVVRNFALPEVEGDPLTVSHAHFELPASMQGKGIAKGVLAEQVGLYQKIDVASIHMEANIDVGGYAWAKYGFTPDDPAEIMGEIKERAKGYNSRVPPEEQIPDAFMKSISPRRAKDIWKVADSPYGKKLLVNSTWEGYLDLSDKKAMERFNTYIGRRIRKADWNEDQHPRDKDGKFSDSPGGGGPRTYDGSFDSAQLQLRKDIKASFPNSVDTIDKRALERWRATFGDVSPAEVKRMMLGPLGRDVNVAIFKYYNSDGSVILRFSGDAPNGRDEWELDRVFHKEDGTVEHDLFKLPDSMQGSGYGKAVLAGQVELYQKIGIREIHLGANIDVGGYAWAKYGFVPSRQLSAERMVSSKIDSYNRTTGYKDSIPKEDVMSMFKDGPKGMWKLADSQYGKKILINSTWIGVLDLNDEEAMTRFNTYIGKRRR